MNNTLDYKGYTGSVEFSAEDELLYGKVLGIRALISYQGTTVSELIQDFHASVDDYLLLCNQEGISPEKAYKGSFNVRIAPELHKQAALYALAHQISLNKFIEDCVQSKLSSI